MRFVIICAIGAFLSSGCVPAGIEARPIEDEEVVAAFTAKWPVVREEEHLVCGELPASMRSREAVLLLTNRQSYSCRDIGFAVRRLARSAAPDDGLWVAAMRSESSSICDFLRAEKISVPVLAVDEDWFAAINREPDLTLFSLIGDSVRVVRGGTGREMLQRLQEFRAGAHPPITPEER